MAEKAAHLPNETPDFDAEQKNVFYEPKETGNPYREAYARGMEQAIERRKAALDAQRRAFIDPEKLAADREGYRKKLIAMFGWPLTEYESGLPVPACRETFVENKDGRSVYRLQLEVMEDVWFYGMLFVPDGAEHAPLVISQHGGGGSPELCSDFNGNNNYRHMTGRLLERGAVVFAPQLLLWKASDEDAPTFPGYGVAYNRGWNESALHTLGGTVPAFELYCLKRSLDYLVTRREVDKDRIGMIGLSYGGMYTLLMSAVDERIKAGYSGSFVSDWETYTHFGDMCWQNSAATFTNAEIIALVAPRAIWLECGANDPVLPPKDAAEADCREALRYFEKQGAAGNLHLNVHQDGHRLSWGSEGYDFLFEHMNAR